MKKYTILSLLLAASSGLAFPQIAAAQTPATDGSEPELIEVDVEARVR